MSDILKYIFGINRTSRVYIRFIIETLSVVVIYIFWLWNINGLETFSVFAHTCNAIIWLCGYRYFGLHKDSLRFSNLTSYLPVLSLSIVIGIAAVIESKWYGQHFNIVPAILFLMLTLNTVVGLRIVARQVIRNQAEIKRDNVLVYGTSEVAIDLYNAMAFGKKYNVKGFISEMHQNISAIAGLPVIDDDDIGSFSTKHNCKLVVLASEVLSKSRQREILRKLDKLGLSVSSVPTIDRAFDYEVQLKSIDPEDVLGRPNTIVSNSLIQAELNHKTILVTGAGGSIGSEICRQVLQLKPIKLIILELNELAMYKLEQELSEYLMDTDIKTQVIYKLGSVVDDVVLDSLFRNYNINIVYHAAAYKHVPIVESNVAAGITNNVFGTKNIAEFACSFDAEKFVLISTDKAVRPTNIMGASKRLAELVIQEIAKSSECTFSIVRFGNVLGSSGSVIPKFKAQINAGGPVTVTHSEITRYFMSIPEAANLVLHAGALANGGEVFLLDMGEPVKIVELAKSMIRQHGLQPVIRSDTRGRQKRDNEIFIDYSGLRPGEKLYEELLIEGQIEETSNPKIFKSKDGITECLDLAASLERIKVAIKNDRPNAIIGLLLELPLSYRPTETEQSTKAVACQVAQAGNMGTEVGMKKQYPVSFRTDENRHSLLRNFFSSKLGFWLLHKYFLMSRGMTLGVRIIVLNGQNEILLVRHSYTNGSYLPGGGVDHGESIESAARREVYEETGITELNGLTFLGLDFNKSVSNRDHVAYFKAHTSQNPEHRNALEIIDCRFFNLQDAFKLIQPEQLKFIDENL